ncbi:FecR family protein [Seonamhaeicola sp.]|uniref:FecR family protein n=1 Tax=Seonamhaeicola sp. TaxID=1912245 RepID=UPI002629DD1E|nr:FecR family protein [Seonamhaeicola sp.]
MTPKIEKIIVKYLTNSASVSDLDTLSEWIEKDSNKALFKDYVKAHFAINYSMNDPETDVAVERLLTAIRKEKSFIYRIKKQPIYRYVAAASVLLIVALTVFLNKGEGTTDIVEPVIVNTSIIEPGTDKATLTLANGEQVSLEKGASFQTSNANSNGEQIVYEAGDRKTQELVYNYLTIPRGGQFYIVLSDGTKVWLNSESQLKYPVSFIEGETRQVELVYGEAYFDVTSSVEHNGSKFIVLNKSQEVEVLGTEFNIKAYKDETNVYTTLVEGNVTINFENKKQNLIPNQQSKLDINSGTVEVSTVDVYNEISWKDGIFSFENASLKDIMKVLSRWYDMEVIFENERVEDEEFIGLLRKDQDIEKIIAAIKDFGIINDYEFKDKILIIK